MKLETQGKGKMALTDTGIKALKPRAGRYIVSDGRGLSLDILPSGKMSWLYRYSFEGKREKATLGGYPDLTLWKARERRDELAAQVVGGKSPAVEAKQRRAGRSTNPTIREFGERYYKEQVIRRWKDPKAIRRYLDNEIFPTLGEKSLKDVNALDVQALVYRKRDNGQVQAAMQLRNVIKQMFAYAIETRLAESPRPRMNRFQVQSLHRPAPEIKQSAKHKIQPAPHPPASYVSSKIALQLVDDGPFEGFSA
jgi:hypothetical protein